MKKRLISFTLASVMCISLAGCRSVSSIDNGSSAYGESSGTNQNETRNPSGNNESEGVTNSSEGIFDNTGSGDEGLVGHALDRFRMFWDSMTDEDRNYYTGGAGNYVNGPDTLDITDTNGLTTNMNFPSKHIELIDDAASLVHGEDPNNFTGVVYHVKDQSNVKTLAEDIKENIMNTQWAYGNPEKLIVADLGDGYVLVAYGKEDTMKSFKERVASTYKDSNILYEENITSAR